MDVGTAPFSDHKIGSRICRLGSCTAGFWRCTYRLQGTWCIQGIALCRRGRLIRPSQVPVIDITPRASTRVTLIPDIEFRRYVCPGCYTYGTRATVAGYVAFEAEEVFGYHRRYQPLCPCTSELHRRQYAHARRYGGAIEVAKCMAPGHAPQRT